MAAAHPAAEDNRVERFVREWEDFDAKRAWVQSLSKVAERQLMGQVLVEWSETDPSGAAKYVAEVSSAAGRAMLVNDAFSSFPEPDQEERFLRWVQSNSDKQTRELIPKLKEVKK